MQKERITEYIQELFSAEAEHLWAKYPEDSIFRHPASKKWFGLIMTIPRNRLGLDGDSSVDILDIKCSPLMIGSLLAEPGFFPAYHMNKDSWITVLLDGTVPDEKLYPLLELSYDAVAPGRRGKNADKRSQKG